MFADFLKIKRTTLTITTSYETDLGTRVASYISAPYPRHNVSSGFICNPLCIEKFDLLVTIYVLRSQWWILRTRYVMTNSNSAWMPSRGQSTMKVFEKKFHGAKLWHVMVYLENTFYKETLSLRQVGVYDSFYQLSLVMISALGVWIREWKFERITRWKFFSIPWLACGHACFC